MGYFLRGWLLSVVVLLGSTANAYPFSPSKSAQTGTQVGLSRLNATIKLEPIILKVGISEYQRTGYVYKRWVDLFEQLTLLSESVSKQPVHFEVAIGTYDEVIQWQDRGQIDLIVLSAKAVADLLMFSSAQDTATLDRTYLGNFAYYTKPGPESDSVLSFYDPREQRLRKRGEYYRSTCLVNARSRIKTIEDLTRIANLPDAGLKFLLCDLIQSLAIYIRAQC